MTWANPEFLYLLAVVPVVAGIMFWRYFKKSNPTLTFSSTSELSGLPGSWRVWGRWIPYLLYLAGFTLVVTALARPQLQNRSVERSAEGIDIVISMDVSTSMLAEDFEPNRLLAARSLASEFVDNRQFDRIGLNVFAGESYTVCPPTVDHRLLKELMESVNTSMASGGTAIGLGIATAINRLKDSEAASRVIILMTDGLNNSGEIDPVTAGELAAAHGIKIYTMGIGSRGTAPYPIHDPVFGTRYQNVEVNIDEEVLTHIAELTGGQYYRATRTDELQQIYQQIDELERTEIEEIIYTDYEDLYPRFLFPGILLGFLALLGERILFRSPLF